MLVKVGGEMCTGGTLVSKSWAVLDICSSGINDGHSKRGRKCMSDFSRFIMQWGFICAARMYCTRNLAYMPDSDHEYVRVRGCRVLVAAPKDIEVLHAWDLSKSRLRNVEH